jgi:hypothetical protein
MNKKMLNRKRSSANEDSELKEDSEQDEEFDVEVILEKKIDVKEGKFYYLIKWKNYSGESNTWEPLSNLTNCLDLVQEFECEQQMAIKDIKNDKKKQTRNVQAIKKNNDFKVKLKIFY